MKSTLTLFTGLLLAPLNVLRAAETLLVDRGEPRAEIVIAEERPRMATLAAVELRHFMQKMSGARLPIVTAPGSASVKIHVGGSAATKRLGVTSEGLRDGAYRIVTGADWVVVLGVDRDFDPKGMPWPLKRNDVPRAQAEWRKLTAGKSDAEWGIPLNSGFSASGTTPRTTSPPPCSRPFALSRIRARSCSTSCAMSRK